MFPFAGSKGKDTTQLVGLMAYNSQRDAERKAAAADADADDGVERKDEKEDLDGRQDDAEDEPEHQDEADVGAGVAGRYARAPHGEVHQDKKADGVKLSASSSSGAARFQGLDVDDQDFFNDVHEDARNRGRALLAADSMKEKMKKASEMLEELGHIAAGFDEMFVMGELKTAPKPGATTYLNIVEYLKSRMTALERLLVGMRMQERGGEPVNYYSKEIDEKLTSQSRTLERAQKFLEEKGLIFCCLGMKCQAKHYEKGTRATDVDEFAKRFDLRCKQSLVSETLKKYMWTMAMDESCSHAYRSCVERFNQRKPQATYEEVRDATIQQFCPIQLKTRTVEKMRTLTWNPELYQRVSEYLDRWEELAFFADVDLNSSEWIRACMCSMDSAHEQKIVNYVTNACNGKAYYDGEGKWEQLQKDLITAEGLHLQQGCNCYKAKQNQAASQKSAAAKTSSSQNGGGGSANGGGAANRNGGKAEAAKTSGKPVVTPQEEEERAKRLECDVKFVRPLASQKEKEMYKNAVPKSKCYKCGANGHIKVNCPSK